MGVRGGPAVVLVGRPNVGKSTLFNRLSGTRRAIVTPVAGTTRDVLSQTVSMQDLELQLTDTGGMFGASLDPLHALVVSRGREALSRADLVVLVLDGREGVVSGDEEIAAALREAGKPVVVAVNKADDRRAAAGLLEAHRLGFQPVIEVSGEHGHGVVDLVDAIVDRLPAAVRAQARRTEVASSEIDPAGRAIPSEVAVAIVGRPNAGKSSLVNRLLKEERMIVSEVPGTTRDSVDTQIVWHERTFRLVDTAGIRKAGRVHAAGQIEQVSVLLARRAIERADVVVLVLDASQGPTDQDAAIAGAAEKAGCGIVIAANKWDLMKGEGPDGYKVFDDRVRFLLKFLDYAPILHISAKTGERAGKVLDAVAEAADSRQRRVPTAELNEFLAGVTAAHPPVSQARRRVRVMYATQSSVAPPTFVLFTNVASELHFSYVRFLQNQLRERYGFVGTPIRISVRRR